MLGGVGLDERRWSLRRPRRSVGERLAQLDPRWRIGDEKRMGLAFAQTSIAKMSAILTRVDTGGNAVFRLLVDSAAALYFCDCLSMPDVAVASSAWKFFQKFEG